MDPQKQNQDPNKQPASQAGSTPTPAPASAPTPASQPSQPSTPPVPPTPPPAFNQPPRKPAQPPVPNSQSNPAPIAPANPINPRVTPPSAQSQAASSANSAQAQAGAVTRNETVKNYINNTESKNKSAVVFAVIAAITITLIAAFAVFFFTKDSGGSDKKAQNIASNEQALEEVPAIPVVEKDSILRSIDSGQSFETYFQVETTKQLGLVDVLTISFHPEVSGEIVVSTYNDGLFLNENTGNTWESVDFAAKRIYSFVLDQANPDSRAFASGIVSENGRIFRTEDKGQSWRAVYAEPGNNTYVSALTQDPLSPNIILAGTNKGTFVRSFDGGDTWENIGQSIKNSIDDFTHDSTRQSFVYLLSRGAVYHSSDAGKNWQNWEEIKEKEIDDLKDYARELRREGDRDGSEAINNRIDALEDKNKEQGLPSGIIEIAADPNKSGVLYAGLTKGLYRSTDYGKYWNPVNIIESAERFPINSIAINPDDSDEISFVAGSSFYRSVNYGQTWAVTPLDKSRNASFITYDPFDSTAIYIGLSAED